MAKKARKKSKAKPAKRAKPRARARAKVRAKKPARRATATARKAKFGSAFQIMIDTINETERLRAKREPRGSDETQ
jgi:hypothetical protein